MKSPRYSRRNFLRQSAVLGLGVCAFGMAPLAAQAARLGREGHAVSQTRIMLGTLVHITAIHPSRDLAEEAVGRAYEEMQRLSAMFNRHEAGTAISVLNDQGHLRGAPGELVMVMDRSLRLNSLSDGAFDVTVAPLVDLFRAKASKSGPLSLTDQEIASAMDLVGSRHVHVSGDSIRFGRQGMRSSLDGIAKGYIVDRASSVLSAHGIQNHLVNAGGDIRALGANDKGRPWRIAIEDPAKKGQYPEIIHLSDGALATSGGYEIFFDRERVYHHIVSPVSGRSPNSTLSVTVKAGSVLEADALSTAAFVMSTQQGIAFIDSLPGRECLVIASDRSIYRSRRWGNMV
jgi:FAD:protein FMN transferase